VAADHDHAHEHGEGHGHDHGVSADADQRYLAIALALIVGFMAGEVVVGIIASSLALISDAAHMLTDAIAIALAILAARLAKRPPKGSLTYGLKRAEILSAQINGMTLLLLAGVILAEAIRRLIEPPEVEGGLVLIVALIGIAVNVAATWVIAKANRQSLNVEGSFRHILTDLYAFIGTAIAGGLILLTGFSRLDAIASIVVAGLMLHSAVILLGKSGRVFLEAAPRGTDPDLVGRVLASQPGVVEIHDLHIWEVTSGFPALTAHVLVRPDVDCHDVRLNLAKLTSERFKIEHTTFQVDHAHTGELVQIEPLEKPAS
jgi:cobalt-zinc-cadmium efflux system protein